MARRNQVTKPLVATAIIALVVLMVAAIYFFYNRSQHNIEDNNIGLINSIALMIDPSDIENLHGDDSDFENQTYIDLLDRVVNVAEVNPNIAYLYILKIKDDNIIFSADSGSVIDGETWPGKVYDDISPKLLKTFETGEPQFHGLSDGSYSDEWGTWVTAYAPIKNADGEVLAVICMDTDRNKFLASIIFDASPPILMMLIFVVILVFYRRGVNLEKRSLEREKELLSVASHEVRSPMVSIKWVLDDMLERSADLSENDRKTVTAVYDNTSKIINSINGVLDSTPTWGEGKAGRDKINMRAMFLEIVDRLRLVALEHKATIIIDDSLNNSVTVRGDKKNLEHAFYNIVNNALKYSFANSEVVISYAKQDGFHEFTISDEGPGVKPEDQKKIFEGMYRTEEAINSGQVGTGLGLYFVKKIIDDHKGKIYVDPDYTGGTAFVVDLPDRN